MRSTHASMLQPSCLPILFLTEMWERFGFYIVQSLLIFYLLQIFSFSDKLSLEILGAFTALSYISPVVGGYLADRFLGHKHAIILGGFLLAAGYALLALQNAEWLYLALATIAVGTGLFKPNISSYLGTFYKENDPRRERGYTLFYIGINAGILLSTTSAGYILQFFGWRANFIFASLGLLIAVTTFVLGMKYLERTDRLKEISSLQKQTRSTLFLIYAGIAGAIYLMSVIMQNTALSNTLFTVGAVIMILTLLHFSYRAGSEHTGKMLACILLIALSSLFWALYYQLFFALNLFISRVLDRNFLGHELPAPLFISMMPIFILLFGSSIGWLWQRLDQINKNPSIIVKFSSSLFCMGIGLLLLVLGTHFTNMHGLVNKSWVILAYLLFALGELLISPIGIAMVTTSIPPAYVSMFIGAYLAAIGFGAKLASIISSMATIPETMHDKTMIAVVYHQAFIRYTEIAFVSGLIILAVAPLVRWLNDWQQVGKVEELNQVG